MRVSETKYVTVKAMQFYGEKAIPLGEVQGDKAKFLLFMRRDPERIVWLTKDEIC